MTIYVDQLVDYGDKGKFRRGYSGKWCHISTDNEDLEELHQFAEKIGLKRSWFQGHPRLPHYDLTPGKRALAIRNGAQNVGPHEFVLMCRRKAK